MDVKEIREALEVCGLVDPLPGTAQYVVKQYLSTIDPEVIRREALQSVRKEMEEWRDDITCGDYDEGYLDGTENALKIIDAAILSAEPAQDDGKSEGLTVEAVNAGLEVGFNGKDASESAWTIYRTNPFANRIGQTVFAEVNHRLEEVKE